MKSKKILLPLLIIIVLLGLIGWTYLKYNSYINEPIDKEDNTEISFQVKKGETAKEITKNLEEKGLIKSDFALYLHIKLNNLGENIIAGRFLLNKTMTAHEMIVALSDPSKAEFIITIQEGLTTKDIDKKLFELGLIESGEFLTAVKNFDGWEYYSFLDKETLKTLEYPVEGYLYPDTYFLDPSTFQPHDLIYLSMDNFEVKFADLQTQLKKHSVHEIITMASIIEKEVIGAENKKIVSGIFWKRQENDWTLGADATLLYVTNDNTLSAEDLEIDSKYNTRKYQGLPPGPISNPSIESIEAAMFPEESEYWFYLTVPETNEVIYSVTNEEHNENKEMYL
jgi:UPF0755 protein